MTTIKDAAVSFLQSVASGRVREAYARHVGDGFRHHNPYFAVDAEALLNGMEANARENPGRELARRILIGTAGWSIPRASAHRFAQEGTHLERYARLFRCVEINSSFHRSHSAATYARWAAATPSRFRFAVKVPRSITHDLKLRRARLPIERFIEETAGLGIKRGPLLVQLPPSLAFEPRVAARFFDLLRSCYDGSIVCEPRHATWFTARANALLVRYQVARVAADPPPAPGAELPGGWMGLVYYRLHGSPRKYWSRYDGEHISALATALQRLPPSAGAWCVFDNTASGAAAENAWELHRRLQAVQ